MFCASGIQAENARPAQRFASLLINYSTHDYQRRNPRHRPRGRIVTFTMTRDPTCQYLCRHGRDGAAAGPYAEFSSKCFCIVRIQRDIAMRGGMRRGWAASRIFPVTVVVTKITFGGCQGGHRPRWPSMKPQSGFPRSAIGDGRPTSPGSVTALPSRTEHPSDFTYHPATSAHTRCIHRASEYTFVQHFIRQPDGKRNAREDTAVRPYAEYQTKVKNSVQTKKCIHY